MRLWAIVPAAGKGTRMGNEVPKQYLPLAGSYVLAHALTRVSVHPNLLGVVVALAPKDPHWTSLPLCVPLHTVQGGAERVFSVLAALHFLRNLTDSEDWVMVHDAARPCIQPSDVEHLVFEAQLGDGALLALPLSDTVKRADSLGQVLETVPRAGLWRALTPQMFRIGPLTEALTRAIQRGETPTDESAAMEAAGYRPKIVQGRPDNLKITHPEDLLLAEHLLTSWKQRDLFPK